MRLRRKKGYRFADDILATDTIISLIFGIGALVCILIAVIMSLATKGHAGLSAGVLLSAAWIMAITAFLFGCLGFKQVEGGTNSKRVAVTISVIEILLLLILLIL